MADFKCTGNCESCGRCVGINKFSGGDNRKTSLMRFPDDFVTEKGKDGYGVAFDIGTTTVVAMLWDREKGILKDIKAEANEQITFGADVISRITYCGRDEEKRERLTSIVRNQMNTLSLDMCKRQGIDPGEIKAMAVCGNTTMSHLIAGYSPLSLALAPFDPAYRGWLEIPAKDMGITAADDCMMIVTPNLAGHVGGDINAGIVAARLEEAEELTLFIDIGTNGEIVLTDGKTMLTCSTAAGPAFEGACISQGMRANSGAIESVELVDGKIEIKTVDNAEPIGICGSGLIDAVAFGLENGAIKANGRLNPDSEYVKKCEEKDVLVLAEKEGKILVALTQNDIREVQLAKGAIKAGETVMAKLLGYELADIKKVKIAGAFGNYIKAKSAVTIGLLPGIPTDCIEAVGNTAGAGVSMILMNQKEADGARVMDKKVKHVELAQSEEFDVEYINSMNF